MKMNKLALSALLVGGLIQASGCIITTDDDPTPTGGLLEVHWPTEACNAPTATVYTMNTATNQMFMDAYACAEGTTATTADPLLLELGTYEVWVEIQNADLTRAHARSLSQTITFIADGEAITVDTIPLATEQGHFEASWTIGDAAGNPLTCAQVGATGGRYIATLANSTEGDAFIYNCDAFYGLSDPLDAGLYTIVVELLDSNDLVIGDSSDAFEESIIGNYIVNLGIFDFIFTP